MLRQAMLTKPSRPRLLRRLPKPRGKEPEATALVSTTAESVSPETVRESGGDWPQWGGTRERNNVPGVKNLPIEWNIGKFDRRTGDWDNSKALNISWFSNLGSQTYGNPVVADGRVFVGTNNGAGHLKRYPSNVDLGCLLAFKEENGDFLWQHSSEKLITGRVHDWPLQGICCAPLVEGDRLWFVTSRGEVRCLDTQGFYDDEDDGPVVDEPAYVADFMSTGPTAASYTATIQGLAEGKLDDVAKQASGGCWRRGRGRRAGRNRHRRKGLEIVRQLWRRRSRFDSSPDRPTTFVLQGARHLRQT